MKIADKIKEVRKKLSLETALTLGLAISATSCGNPAETKIKEAEKNLTELTAPQADDVKHSGIETSVNHNSYKDFKECLNKNGLTFEEPKLENNMRMHVINTVITDKDNNEVGYMTRKIISDGQNKVVNAHAKFLTDENSQLAKDLQAKGIKTETCELAMHKNEKVSEYMKREHKIIQLKSDLTNHALYKTRHCR